MAIADPVGRLHQLCTVSVDIMAEITALHDILDSIQCTVRHEDQEVVRFYVAERTQVQTLLQKKYAMLSAIDAMRSQLLDPT